MERNDIVVLENLQQEDDQPRYLVVLAKEIEKHAADGSSYDYSLKNAENGAGWYEYFDDSETEDNLGEPTQEQINELEAYLEENYNYLPE